MSKDREISMSVIRRLPRYYRFLYNLKQEGKTRISSSKLASLMGLTASQIRQDLNCFGEFGQQGYGYMVDQLYDEISKILGIENPSPAVIIGIGNMGKAISKYMDFENRGIVITGLFDDSPEVIGETVGNMKVKSMEELEHSCNQYQVEVGILCVPNEAGPEVTKQLIKTGVKTFWNFTHYDIAYNHEDTIVENVHLDDSLMTLSYRLNKSKKDKQNT